MVLNLINSKIARVKLMMLKFHYLQMTPVYLLVVLILRQLSQLQILLSEDCQNAFK